jgi:methylenetetrahydrofolate dehydrogenase (NADP+)/methenyltetrahydrofolate cyclohydrolase
VNIIRIENPIFSLLNTGKNNGNQSDILFLIDFFTNHFIDRITIKHLTVINDITLYLCAMKILDGQLVSQAIKDELSIKVARLTAEGKKVPHLAAVLVGDNGASETYVASKVKTCQQIGFKSTLIRLPEDISEFKLLNTIEDLNSDPEIDGILVQLPLPKSISGENVINAIDPSKDVDGFHPSNAGRMIQGLSTFLPATPHGIMLLLEHYRIDTKGMHAVIIGRSNIVGRPMSLLLSSNTNPGNCTVTICHSHTRDLESICRKADIIVAALGRAEFVTADMVKEGAIVIDVGITRVPDSTKKKGYILKGDVQYSEVASKSSYITPVPGGVGPMTIAALMKNTYKACADKN